MVKRLQGLRSQLFLCIIVFSAANVFAQPSFQLPSDTIATVGTDVITGSDFLERFELMPWPGKDNKARLEYTKQQFLYSLVAERLLSFEATNVGIDRDSVSQVWRRSLEKMFSRDELFKREVMPRIKVTSAEIRSGLKKYAYQLQAAILGFPSREKAELLYKKVSRAASKDSVLSVFKDSLYLVLDTAAVNFGGEDIPFENAAYSVVRGQLSRPFEDAYYGWIILHVLSKGTNPKCADQSLPDQIASVQRIIHDRQEDAIAQRVFFSILGKQKAEASPRLFLLLADSVYALLYEDSTAHKVKNYYMIGPGDLERLAKNFHDRLDEQFITAENSPAAQEGGAMTFGDIIEGLKYNEIVFPSLNRRMIEAILNNNIKTVVQNELIAREAFRKNIQYSPQVRHDVGVWYDNRRAHDLFRRVTDTVEVSDEELMRYYKDNARLYGGDVEVNIREILVDSIPLAQKIRERILSGEDMSLLARKYSERKAWAENGGESGWFPSKEHGDLGFYAATADSGQLIGPLRIKEGLTLFKVLGKRTLIDTAGTAFEQNKGAIRGKLLEEKKQKIAAQYVAGLAKRYGVTINQQALRTLYATASQMFTWRYLGFGGRIMAVPSVVLDDGWYQEYLRPIPLNQ
ncbi:MAG: peptidylprolyl isomerase [Bacteroidota bacterium]|nr:peptidylprolyl isomerase [Bacteroidota bacterium]